MSCCLTFLYDTNGSEIWLRLWTEKADGSKDARYLGGYIGFTMASMFLGTFNLG